MPIPPINISQALYGISILGSSVSNFATGHFNREAAKIARRENREFQLELEKYRESINLAINQKNIDSQKWRFEREKQLQLKIFELTGL